jgi:hypothetical protein
MLDRQLDEQQIFHVAREIPKPETRREYLDQMCAGDAYFQQSFDESAASREGLGGPLAATHSGCFRQ